MKVNREFLLFLFFNTFMFASAGVIASMVVKSHADQTSLNSFVIVPMSFLCGTFFFVVQTSRLGMSHCQGFTAYPRQFMHPCGSPWKGIADGLMYDYVDVLFVGVVYYVRRVSI
jgi:hypothetical protein